LTDGVWLLSDEIKNPESVQTADGPVISIALLIKNGMPRLKDLLANLRGQQGCPPFEIVAVDSGSTDGSLEALRVAGVCVTQISPETFRFGTARQMAFALTRGQVIVTMSQDAIPGGDGWLAAITKPILNRELDLVQASEVVPQHENLKLALLNYATPYQHWKLPYSKISCVGLAISRSAWQQTGFGDVQMSEDHYLGMIAREKNIRMGICTASQMLHWHSYSFMGHIKRSFNEGMGARTSDGYYSLCCMLRDIFRIGPYLLAATSVIKYRALPLFEASWFLFRPIFLYIGWRFGKKYWP
jgi:glycosyltransferase involved in cell wall biosynthesis